MSSFPKQYLHKKTCAAVCFANSHVRWGEYTVAIEKNASAEVHVPNA